MFGEKCEHHGVMFDFAADRTDFIFIFTHIKNSFRHL